MRWPDSAGTLAEIQVALELVRGDFTFFGLYYVSFKILKITEKQKLQGAWVICALMSLAMW